MPVDGLWTVTVILALLGMLARKWDSQLQTSCVQQDFTAMKVNDLCSFHLKKILNVAKTYHPV